VVSLSLIFIQNNLNAQEPDVYDLSLEQILNIEISSASDFKETKKDTASSVSKITEEEWHHRSAKTVADVIGFIPGVSLAYSANNPSINMRGLQDNISFRRTLNLIDGISVNDSTYSFPSRHMNGYGNLSAYQSIEVIRGPVSVLYGTDAFNGALSLNTWDSDEEVTEVRGTIGQFGYHDASIRNMSKQNDIKVVLNFSVNGQNNENRKYGYQDQATGGTKTEVLKKKIHNTTLNNKISYKNSELSFFWDYGYKESDGFIAEFTGVSKDGTQINQSHDFKMYSFKHNHRINDRSQLKFKVFKWRSESDNDVGADVGPVITKTLDLDQQERKAGGDIKYLFESDDEHLKFIVGVGHEKTYSKADLSAGSRKNSYKQRTVNSARVNLEYLFFDKKFKAIAGARYDIFNTVENHFSPRLGFIHYFNNENTFKVLYGHAFRAPSFEETVGIPSFIDPAITPLEPETNDTIELNHIYSSKKLNVNTTAFYNKLKKGITNFPGGTTVFIYENAGEAENYGLEIETQYKSKSLDLFGSGAYTRAKLVSPTKNSSHFQGYPTYSFSYGGIYKFAKYALDIGLFNNHLINRKGFVSGFTSYEEGRSITNYFRTDLSSTYHLKNRDGNNKVFIKIRNILNRDNYLSRTSSSYNGMKDEAFNVVIGFKSVL